MPNIINVGEEKYNRLLNNCKKNKTHSSWIYLTAVKSKVYYWTGACGGAGGLFFRDKIKEDKWGNTLGGLIQIVI